MSLVVGTNSYVNVEDADIYFLHALHAKSWVDSTTPTKENALVTATRMFDRRQWSGTKYGDPQTLDWPRTGITDPEGEAIAEDSIPQFMIDATCELALALIEDISIQSPDGSEIRRIKAETVEVEFFGGSNVTSLDSTGFPTIVQELVIFYLAGGFQGPFVSGTDNEPAIEDFDLNKGY